MYCKKCGKELKEGAKFCSSCGEKTAAGLAEVDLSSAGQQTTPVGQQAAPSGQQAAPTRQQTTPSGQQTTPSGQQTAPSGQQTAPTRQQTAPAQQEKPAGKKSGGRVLTITLVVLFTAVLGIAAGILFYGSKEKPPVSAETKAAGKSIAEKEADLTVPSEDKAAVTATEAAEEAAAPVKLSPEEAEREVLVVREKWTTDREKILNNTYVSRTPEPGVTAYYDEQNRLVMIESTKEKAQDGFGRTYEYQDGKLIFVFYESAAEECRLYFKDGHMFRLDKRTGGEPFILDTAYEDPEFVYWENKGATEGSALYDNALAAGNLPAQASVPAQLVEAATVNTTGLYKLTYSGSGESSHIKQAKYDNTAKAAMDNDEASSWQESVAGSGINEQVWYSFDRDYEFRYISLKLGNWRNDRYFVGNNKPRRLKIVSGGNSASIEFPAERKEYWVELPSWVGNQLSFTIEDVYRGNGEYDDTCIAEIGVYGK